MKYIVSIDPGQKGFITVLAVGKVIAPLEFYPMPIAKTKVNKKDKVKIDETKLNELLDNILSRYGRVKVVIEKQHVVSTQGIVSSAKNLEHYGYLKGLCIGKGIELEVIGSKTWQGIYPDYIAKDSSLDTKEKSIKYCKELYPSIDLRKSSRCRTLSDGKTDSILIGTWAGLEELKEDETRKQT